jgi:hypothetical protein
VVRVGGIRVAHLAVIWATRSRPVNAISVRAVRTYTISGHMHWRASVVSSSWCWCLVHDGLRGPGRACRERDRGRPEGPWSEGADESAGTNFFCVTSHLKIDHQTEVGSARMEVVRFVGCGGLATFLAPGRDTYRRTGSVWSAAFQPCKKTCNIIEMAGKCERLFPIMCRSGVAVRLLPGSCPVPARFLPGGRFLPLPGSCPVPARFLPGSCPVPYRFLPDGRAGTASVGRFLRRSRAATAAPLSGGCCTNAAPAPLCGCFP